MSPHLVLSLFPCHLTRKSSLHDSRTPESLAFTPACFWATQSNAQGCSALRCSPGGQRTCCPHSGCLLSPVSLLGQVTEFCPQNSSTGQAQQGTLVSGSPLVHLFSLGPSVVPGFICSPLVHPFFLPAAQHAQSLCKGLIHYDLCHHSQKIAGHRLTEIQEKVPSEESPRRNQACLHLDLELPAPRIMK